MSLCTGQATWQGAAGHWMQRSASDLRGLEVERQVDLAPVEDADVRRLLPDVLRRDLQPRLAVNLGTVFRLSHVTSQDCRQSAHIQRTKRDS